MQLAKAGSAGWVSSLALRWCGELRRWGFSSWWLGFWGWRRWTNRLKSRARIRWRWLGHSCWGRLWHRCTGHGARLRAVRRVNTPAVFLVQGGSHGLGYISSNLPALIQQLGWGWCWRLRSYRGRWLSWCTARRWRSGDGRRGWLWPGLWGGRGNRTLVGTIRIMAGRWRHKLLGAVLALLWRFSPMAFTRLLVVMHTCSWCAGTRQMAWPAHRGGRTGDWLWLAG